MRGLEAVSLAMALSAAAVPGVRIARLHAALSAPAPASDRERFVGTYRLVTIESRDAAGQWKQDAGFNSVGYITYSDTGYMGVYIMPKSRAPFAKPNNPTPEEAQAALQGFTAYFGPYSIDLTARFVVHHRVGHLDNGAPDFKRFYEFADDTLILRPAAATGGTEQATTRLIWQRLPDANLSLAARTFVGVYALRYTDTARGQNGRETFHGDRNETRAGTSYIIYTPTGHMMVHLMDKAGRKLYAGSQPTPDEALAAYRSYAGYFGRFSVHIGSGCRRRDKRGRRPPRSVRAIRARARRGCA